MKYLNIKKIIPAIAVIAILFSSCDKPNEVDPIGDRGQTLVKILDGGSPVAVIKKPVDFVPTPTKVLAIEIRRDVANNADLNKTMTVVIKDDTAAVRLANPNYVILPSNFYTIQSEAPKVGGSGGTFTFTFQPGEFAKQIYITIPNATVLNPSTLYGLGFSVVSASAGGVISVSKTAVVEIGAKNPWDGVYQVTGPMIDLVNPSLTQWISPTGEPWELHLITTGANTVVMFDNTIWGDYFHPIKSGAANSGYGSFALVVTFDPATNAITQVVNYYGQPAGNTRSAKLDPSGVNAVQGNKDILIKYFMIQTNQSTGANPRVYFNETWKYIRPR